MSKMKQYLLSKSEEVEQIIFGCAKAQLALVTHTCVVAKAFHHSTAKSLVARLIKAGYQPKTYPFINGRYNVVTNLNIL